MTRRIMLAILAVTALAEVLFAVPLALSLRRGLTDQDRLELTNLAALAANEVVGDRLVAAAIPPPEPAQELGLYDAAAVRIDGTGPVHLEPVVAAALANRVIDTRVRGWLVVAVPVIEAERVVGVIRTAEPLAAGTSRAHVVWLQLLALAGIVLVFSGIAALGLARRLTRPLEHLGRDAARIGEGDFTVAAAHTGIPEIDSVGTNLSITAERVSSLFAREQAFTADASHQLRSPLTGLRLTLEAELAHPRADGRQALTQALVDVDRLEAMIADLLDLARDTTIPRAPVDLVVVLDQLRLRWQATLARSGRRLTIVRADGVPSPTVSAAALAHVLDVLVDNAIRHGAGEVRVQARSHEGAVSVSVTDQGPGVADPLTVFERRRSAHGGTGIGLALARRLAEAEGGRLRLQGGGEGTTFEVTLPATAAPADVLADGRSRDRARARR